MAKFNWAVFKKGKTLYWVLGAVVLFVIFYLIASRGASSGGSGGGVTSIQQGPSDAAVASNAAITQSQIAGSVATTVAGYDLAAKQSQQAADVAIAGLAANVQSLDITSQVKALQLQSEYSLESAKVAAQTNLALAGINTQALQIQTAGQLEAQRIASQGDLGIAAIQASVARDQISAAVAQTQIQSLTAIALGEQSADVNKKLLDNQLLLGLDTNRSNVERDNIASATAIMLGSQNRDVQMANINASAFVATTQLQEGTKQIVAQLSTNERMFNNSLETQAYVADLQSKAFAVGTLASVAAGVVDRDKDNAYALLQSAVTGQATTYKDSGSGSFSTGSSAGLFGGDYTKALSFLPPN